MVRADRRQSAAAKRSDRETVVTLRLSRELHERLKQASGERGFAVEVRRRIEASFASQPLDTDEKTETLLAQISEVARSLAVDHAPWHASPYSRSVLSSAVTTLISASGPGGEPVYEPKPNTLLEVIFGQDEVRDPDKVGKMYAWMMLTGSMKGEKS